MDALRDSAVEFVLRACVEALISSFSAAILAAAVSLTETFPAAVAAAWALLVSDWKDEAIFFRAAEALSLAEIKIGINIRVPICLSHFLILIAPLNGDRSSLGIGTVQIYGLIR